MNILIKKSKWKLDEILWPGWIAWLRSLIEQATGLQTGSIYSDIVMPRGEKGVVIKTHEWDMYKYTRAIYIIRNPFDVIASYYRYRQNILNIPDMVWDDFVINRTTDWSEHIKHWIAAKQNMPIYQVRYEDLLLDTESELEKILKWRGLNVNPAAVKQAVSDSKIESMRDKYQHAGSTFFRKGQAGTGIERFSEAQRIYVVDQLGELMTALGYEVLA